MRKFFFVTSVLAAIKLKLIQSEKKTCDGDSESTSSCSFSFPSSSYGMDVSWPMTGSIAKNSSLFPNKQAEYNLWMEKCALTHNETFCDVQETARIERIIRQPKSMVNFTSLGYSKIKAPPELFALIIDFWQKNKQYQSVEHPTGVINDWESPSYMVSLQNKSLSGGGVLLVDEIFIAAQTVIREWTNQQSLKTSSVYGVRVYTSDAILLPHVDRLPLICSAIINVDQDVDEPWPLEVIGHDGIAVNITMEPGDMVLYESHSIIHGRPFKLKGRYYANVFIHFAPTKQDKYTPSYMIEMSQAHFDLLNLESQQKSGVPDYTITHEAARAGDFKALIKILAAFPDEINKQDANGWTPLMEAAAKGNIKIVKYLLAHKADASIINIQGFTVFDIVQKLRPQDSALLQTLEKVMSK